MKRPNGAEIKALFILSIIVPVGLVASFRLTGIFKEPPKVERITLEPVTLTLQRPSGTLERINGSAQSEWTQDGASISAGIYVCSYLEGAGSLPFAGHDGLVFKIYVNASATQGYFNTVKISFRPLDANAVVFADQNQWGLQLHNATITSMHSWGTNETDAYLEVDMLSSPCSMRDQIFWVFQDEYQDHEIQIIAEIVYTSETSIEIITIQMKIILSEEAVD